MTNLITFSCLNENKISLKEVRKAKVVDNVL